MDERLPRKLAAILYADVEGYSRLTGEDEDATHRALGAYLDLIAATVKAHGGQVMHFAGDAVLAKFEAVVDALSAAVTIQTDINTRNQEVPEHRRVQFRIGVNLGDVIEDRDDIYGEGVNVAARLESLAEPGGICVSESVRLALGSKLPLAFECMGEQEVKNIAESVVAYRANLQSSTSGGESRGEAATEESPSRKPSIAVLPFTNMSGDPEQEYFSDGIAEDIIIGLTRFRALEVIARGSSFALKNKAVDVTQSALQLGCQYVLEGSVRRAGKQVRITAQLADGETGRHVWAETYDRVLEDVFAVQDDVVSTIVSTLAGRLEDELQKRALTKSPTNLSAYDYYLRAKHRWPNWRGTKENVLQARELFYRATEVDPTYGAAYMGLAESYIAEFFSSWTTQRETAGGRSFEFAKKAVELDDRNGETHRVLAAALCYVKSDFERAEAQLQQALELNPNDYWNYCLKTNVSLCTGNFEDSVYCANEAIRRNPFLPDGCLYAKGFSEYFSHEFEAAVKTFSRLVAPGLEIQGCVAACFAQLERDEDAQAAAEVFREEAAAEFPDLKEVDEETWHRYWSSLFNFKDAGQINRLLEGLKKAGLP